jgi:hypothetical protein
MLLDVSEHVESKYISQVIVVALMVNLQVDNR